MSERVDVEAHYRSIVGPQASFVGVHLQFMLLQKGDNLSQVLGMLLPGMVEEETTVDVHQNAG